MKTYKRAVSAKRVDGLNIAVTFEDGSSGIFDFSPYAGYPCYAPLKKVGLFDAVYVDHGTLTWPGGIDIAPETVWSERRAELPNP